MFYSTVPYGNRTGTCRAAGFDAPRHRAGAIMMMMKLLREARASRPSEASGPLVSSRDSIPSTTCPGLRRLFPQNKKSIQDVEGAAKSLAGVQIPLPSPALWLGALRFANPNQESPNTTHSRTFRLARSLWCCITRAFSTRISVTSGRKTGILLLLFCFPVYRRRLGCTAHACRPCALCRLLPERG